MDYPERRDKIIGKPVRVKAPSSVLKVMFGSCNHQFPFDFSSFLNPRMLSCKLLSFGTHFTWKCTLIIKELEILSINGFDIT